MDPAVKAALKKRASQIADMLGEKGNVQRFQIHRILCLMGEEWVGKVIREVETLAATSALIAHKEDGTPRTIGGMFFKAAKTIAWTRMEAGEIPRPVFHRVFHGWARKPKPPPPPPKPKKPPPPPKKAKGPAQPPPKPKAHPHPNGDRRKNGPPRQAPEPTVEYTRPPRRQTTMPEIEYTVVRRRPAT